MKRKYGSVASNEPKWEPNKCCCSCLAPQHGHARLLTNTRQKASHPTTITDPSSIPLKKPPLPASDPSNSSSNTEKENDRCPMELARIKYVVRRGRASIVIRAPIGPPNSYSNDFLLIL